ncbi:MAG: polyphosphate:AMP phosphotransferase [Gammaproteobacteria bacterium]|nr:MAG: polyphosphate:AMP phosphotransferase [Gammaproteobacteria bacterium]
MFEVAELGHTISKKEYEEQVAQLRVDLLEAQQDLKDADFPVIILVSGVDGGGKGNAINLLNEWMDPRYIRTHAFGPRTEEERLRPHSWRYWMALPPKGRTGVFVGSWYSEPISKRMKGDLDTAGLDAALIQINGLEKQLTDDGALIVKCWLHLSRERQKKRIKRLLKDPENAWRVSRHDLKNLKHYDEFICVAERVLRETSTAEAPWMIIDGSNNRYSALTVGRYVHAQIRQHLEERKLERRHRRKLPQVVTGQEIALLDALDLSLRLNKKDYRHQLALLQGRLNRLSRKQVSAGRSLTVVFEGWDAAGKGGCIRRITHALDARFYQVIPIAAPTDEEKAHHYLWRFWRHIPRDGRTTIYDRSWYGRVLVERIEGFAREDEWMRAYTEINQFEEELSSHGIIILKFWLHISKEEQLRRFKEREQIPYKRFKITEEDYRNREKWDDYSMAVNDMVTRTSSEFAPWHLIEAEDKRYARVKVLRTIVERLERELDAKS